MSACRTYISYMLMEKRICYCRVLKCPFHAFRIFYLHIKENLTKRMHNDFKPIRIVVTGSNRGLKIGWFLGFSSITRNFHQNFFKTTFSRPFFTLFRVVKKLDLTKKKFWSLHWEILKNRKFFSGDFEPRLNRCTLLQKVTESILSLYLSAGFQNLCESDQK